MSSNGSNYSSDSDFSYLSTEKLYYSSDSTSDGVEFVDTAKASEQSDEPAKAGRRNIRSVQSDAFLASTTKKAQREEDERRDRLFPRTQMLSQLSVDEGLVLDVDEETKNPLIIVDDNITDRLKPHQKEGVRFMWNNCYESVRRLKTDHGTGCILAHCMGLGKSFQVITLIHTLFKHSVTNTKHVLIVCPLSTVLNWENEFKICYKITKDKTQIKRYLITDGKSKIERYKMVTDWYHNNGILILGYDSFLSLLKVSGTKNVRTVPKKVVEALLDPGPDLIICDEGHLIKNGAKNRAKTLAKIKTKRRIILTGTPMQNNLTEYFHMIDFVKPNLLGTKREFSNRFSNPITNGGYDDSTESDIRLMRQRSHVLHEYLKDTIQRYEITELQNYLPEKLDYVLFIQLHPLQVELYKAYLESVSSVEKKAKAFFPDYMRLKDVWTHPCILRLKEQNKAHQNKRKEIDTIIVEPEVQEMSNNEWWHSRCPEDFLSNIAYGPKMTVMLEIIEQSMRLEDKVLVFGTSLAELDAIEYFLQENGFRKNVSYLRMDGTVPPDSRMASCDKFNSKMETRIKIFLLSHQVGGLGLNLVAANRIILMDVNFNPAIDSQSIFRTYRFGQNKRCHVYRLVSMGTMEEVVYERSITKLSVSLRVVDEHQISRHYKSHDLQKMYRFTIYTDEQRPPPKLPIDEVLATILEKCKQQIFKYHEHQDLLENQVEEQLNEEEQRIAWDEFRREQEAYQKQVEANNLKILSSKQGLNGLNQASVSADPLSTNPLREQLPSEPAPLSPEILFVSDLASRVSEQAQPPIPLPGTSTDILNPDIVFIGEEEPENLSSYTKTLQNTRINRPPVPRFMNPTRPPVPRMPKMLPLNPTRPPSNGVIHRWPHNTFRLGDSPRASFISPNRPTNVQPSTSSSRFPSDSSNGPSTSTDKVSNTVSNASPSTSAGTLRTRQDLHFNGEPISSIRSRMFAVDTSIIDVDQIAPANNNSATPILSNRLNSITSASRANVPIATTSSTQKTNTNYQNQFERYQNIFSASSAALNQKSQQNKDSNNVIELD